MTRLLRGPSLVVGLVFVLGGPSSAQAGPDDNYALVTIINETPYRVDYSYRWGGDPPNNWNNYIKANGTYVHSHKFRYKGQDYAPWFYIELDGDSGDYKLRSFYSPDEEAENGRVYYIRWDEANSKFKLYGKLYTE